MCLRGEDVRPVEALSERAARRRCGLARKRGAGRSSRSRKASGSASRAWALGRPSRFRGGSSRGLSVCDRALRQRICSQNRWRSAFGKKKGRDRKRPGPPARNAAMGSFFSPLQENVLNRRS